MRRALEWILALVLAIICGSFLLGFVGGIYRVENTSMEPNLREGDVIWAQKWNINHRLYYPSLLSEKNDTLKFGWNIKHLVFENKMRKALKRDDVVLTQRTHNSKQITTIKRIVALPGDTLKIRNRKRWINGGLKAKDYACKFNYRINFNSVEDRIRIAKRYPNGDLTRLANGPFWMLSLPDSSYKTLCLDTGIIFIRPIFELPSNSNDKIWPFWSRYGWNEDNFGPLYIPQKGDSIVLNRENVNAYADLIARTEGNIISRLPNGLTLVNGKEQAHYVFTKDYYFLLGDNRHQSLDSRFYGPIPADKITAKAKKIIFGIFAAENDQARFNKNRFWKAVE